MVREKDCAGQCKENAASLITTVARRGSKTELPTVLERVPGTGS